MTFVNKTNNKNELKRFKVVEEKEGLRIIFFIDDVVITSLAIRPNSPKDFDQYTMFCEILKQLEISVEKYLSGESIAYQIEGDMYNFRDWEQTKKV